jgi:acetyl-CoA carboxylase biotin carboxyl carrier protein
MSSKFSIDGDAIRKLAEILVETDLTEIEYEDDGRRVRVARRLELASVASAPLPQFPPVTEAVPEKNTTSEHHHHNAIKSPMVGTVYIAPEPGAAPFVKVGDTISLGQTLLIIEAMKVMNPIKAPKSGKVTQIFVRDGSPVEFGEPLMVIE